MALVETQRWQSTGRISSDTGLHGRIQLLLVDDYKIALDAFRLYASSKADFQVTAILNDRIRAVRKLKQSRPNVVVVNMRMRNPDGATAARLLLSVVPDAKVIGFGDLQNRETVLSMLRAGACGFVSQTSSLTELFRAVRTVIRGDGFLCPKISRLILEEYKRSAAKPTKADPYLSLNDCERRILVMIADGKSNKEMAAKLNVSVRTVEKYREHLMSKLHIKTVAGLTKFAIRAGIVSLE